MIISPSHNLDLISRWYFSGRVHLTPDEAIAILQSPEIMAKHDPKIVKLIRLVQSFPAREHAALLRREIRVRFLVHRANSNPFFENAPSRGELPELKQGRVPLLTMETGGVLSVEVGLNGTAKNIITAGPTGSGKTNWLKALLLAAAGQAIIVVFDRKGDLAPVVEYEQPGDVVLLEASDLKLAMFQPPPGMAVVDFISIMTEMLARNLSLIASRRLISDTLMYLFTKKGKGGEQHKVCLSEVVEHLERMKVHAMSRLGQYREAVLYALKDLHRRSSGILDYSESNFLEQVFSQRRTLIIDCGNIAVDHLSIIVSLFYMYIYESRRIAGTNSPSVMIVVDDALPLVTGSSAAESEGGINPISTWSFMGRSFNIGLVISGQNFSIISPALRNNTDTVMCFGGSGEDVQAIARHMNLTPEQAACIPRLQPGEVIAFARSVWPYAVKGYIPKVR